MSITQLELEENCIQSIEKNNIEKLKQYLSSGGFSVNSFLRGKQMIWVNEYQFCTVY
jgi:hypothetical protein